VAGARREILQAILELDIPLIVGVVLVTAVAIAVANLMVDLVSCGSIRGCGDRGDRRAARARAGHRARAGLPLS